MGTPESAHALENRLNLTADVNFGDLQSLNKVNYSILGVKTMLRTYFGC